MFFSDRYQGRLPATSREKRPEKPTVNMDRHKRKEILSGSAAEEGGMHACVCSSVPVSAIAIHKKYPIKQSRGRKKKR